MFLLLEKYLQSLNEVTIYQELLKFLVLELGIKPIGPFMTCQNHSVILPDLLILVCVRERKKRGGGGGRKKERGKKGERENLTV